MEVVKTKDTGILRYDTYFNADESEWVLPHSVVSVEAFATSRRPFWRGTAVGGLSERIITETADSFMDALETATRP
jgi:hypothetical protein